jgi:hypothetical protein
VSKLPSPQLLHAGHQLHPPPRACIVAALPEGRLGRSPRRAIARHRSDQSAAAKLPMKDRFERHRQPWTPAEIAKLHQLAGKSWSLRDIATALKRSEESVKIRAKLDKLVIASKR